MNGKESVSFAAISCTHSPLHDNAAIDWACEKIEEFEPDVLVHLGDFLEADAASRWPSEYTWTLADEFREADKVLRRFRECSPDARHILLEGNHDSNVLAINRIDPKLRGLVDYHEGIPEITSGRWEMPCTYVYNRNRGVFRLGQVTFGHGYESNASADEMQSITLGVPYGLWVGGHTHRPLRPTQALRTKTVPLPFWYANTGTLRNIDKVPYMERKRRYAWGQGLILGEAGLWRYSESLMPQSKLWDAELQVCRMYEDPRTAP